MSDGQDGNREEACKPASSFWPTSAHDIDAFTPGLSMFPEIVPKWFHSAPKIYWIHLSQSVDQYQWKVLHSNFLIKKLYTEKVSLSLSLPISVCLSASLSFSLSYFSVYLTQLCSANQDCWLPLTPRRNSSAWTQDGTRSSLLCDCTDFSGNISTDFLLLRVSWLGVF